MGLGRGYNIGIRLIDEFLAKSKTGKCIDFRDTADKIAKVHVVHGTQIDMIHLLGISSQQRLKDLLICSGWLQDVPQHNCCRH